MLIDEDFNNVPSDFDKPKWDVANRVHNWRNYVDDEVKDIWDSFSLEAKQALAQNFNNIADREEWD